jgi:hypothetical protein
MDSVFTNTFIWAQIFGFLGFVISVWRLQLKNPRHVVLAESPAGAMWAAQYYLLNAQAGLIINFICIFRGIIIYAFPQKAMKFILAISIALILTIVVYQSKSYYDIFAIMGVSLYGIACLYRDNRPVMARIITLHCIPWLIYNILAFSVFGVASSALGIVSGIIGMYRHEKWEIEKCYRSFTPSILKSLFTFPTPQTYP